MVSIIQLFAKVGNISSNFGINILTDYSKNSITIVCMKSEDKAMRNLANVKLNTWWRVWENNHPYDFVVL